MTRSASAGRGRRGRRSSLPAPIEPFRGSFVGREDDLRAIAAALAGGARLLTLLGPGGVGKTRLLHRLLVESTTRFAASTFCDLTAARTAGDVVAQVATSASAIALGAATTTAEASRRLGRALARGGPTLLALDNLERIEPAAFALVTQWLSAARDLVVVVTSRVRLGVAGEVVYRVAPLSTARGADRPSEAVRLFEDRAAAVRGPFTEDERPTAERIVELLEGMPLALEMAASRLAVLSPRELLARLSRPLAVLDHGPRADPDRHASLSRVLDDSWELLDAAERRALAELGVFVGGFTIGAAEAVLSAGPDALGVVQRLADSSLLRSAPSRSGSARHALWEVVREYALERLAASGELDATRERHARHFAEWGAERAAQLDGSGAGADAATASSELVDEAANLAAAAAFMATRDGYDDAVARLELLVALAPVHLLRGQLEAYARELAEALARADTSPSCERRLFARASLAHARVLHELGRPDEAATAYERARRGDGDPTICGLSLCGHGRLLAGLGRWEEALACFAEARALPDGSPAVAALARACHEFYGTECGESTDEVAAIAAYVECCRRGGDPRELVFWTVQLGRSESELTRDRAAAERHLEEALALARSIGDLGGEGFALFGLGAHQMGFGMLHDAIGTLEESVSVLRDAGMRRYEGWARGFLGVTHALTRAFEEARRALDAAIAVLHDVGDAPRESLLLAFRAAARARIDDADGARADLARARELAPATSCYHGWTIDLCEGQLALDGAEALLQRACWPGGRADEPREWPWGSELFEPRLAAELLERSLREARARTAPLRIAVDGSWFSLPSGDLVRTPGRGKLHAILVALGRARDDSPSTPVPASALVAAAWPGERMRREAASNRLHVALDTLRRIGLRDVLVRGEGGWHIDPETPFAWAEGPPAGN